MVAVTELSGSSVWSLVVVTVWVVDAGPVAPKLPLSDTPMLTVLGLVGAG